MYSATRFHKKIDEYYISHLKQLCHGHIVGIRDFIKPVLRATKHLTINFLTYIYIFCHFCANKLQISAGIVSVHLSCHYDHVIACYCIFGYIETDPQKKPKISLCH